jgi:glycosyltransferase involved in cell wall biosynthesis
MNILLLTQVLPYPPDSGPKVKTYNMVKFISQNHNLTLVSFVRGDQAREVEHLKRFCKAVYTVPIRRTRLNDGLALVKSLATSTPWFMARDDVREMRALLADLCQREIIDIVHADQLNMAQYANQVPCASRILDAHNALWLLYRRLAQTTHNFWEALFLEREWRLLKRYEGAICRTFDAVLTVSEADKAALEEASGGKGNLMVAPIAVDPETIQPVPRVPQADHILHIGTMFWPPNVDGVLWFLRKVYPIIQQARPDVHFDIVGARPPKEVTESGRSLEGVTVTGYVKEPEEYLRKTGVMVVPLLAGGGMRVKILEALAEGLPIVTTSIGCEGIAVENGRHLLVADSPQEFAQATLRLLNDRSFANTLARNGRELIEKNYDYHFAYRPVNLVYEGCIKN